VEQVTAALEAVQPVLYVGVAVAAFRRWTVLRRPPAAWAAAMFAVLGAAITAGRVLGPAGPEDAGSLARRLLVVGIVAFPYLLLRFAASFQPVGRWIEGLAAVLTAAAVGGILVVPEVPGAGEPRDVWFRLYAALVVVQWVGLSSVVTWRFWSRSRDRPTVVRRRMRTLAAGSAALALALLLAGTGTAVDRPGAALVIASLAVLAPPLFLAGLAPPAVLLWWWRRRDERELAETQSALVAATDPAEVGGALLPYVTRALGGDAAVLSHDGQVVAHHGTGPDDADAVAALSAAGLARRSDAAVVAELTSGRLVVLGDRYTPFFGRDEADVLGRLGELTDIALRRAEVARAEREAAAELARAHDAMREFVSIASHDLRTPVAVVKGYVATMAQSWDAISDHDKREYLAIIGRQADHLSRMVGDLLVLSRLDAGAVAPDPDPVDLADLVGEVVADLGAADQVHVAVPAPAVVWFDEDHATRIVRNLVENALRYGEPPVLVSSAACPGGIEVRVRDHGQGVPDELAPSLFDRFTRGPGATARAKHGTGLGLSIVRGLARAGGGEAWYEPASPGARFVVRFPTVEQAGAPS
jgi:signal transduction histidine kinase